MYYYYILYSYYALQVYNSKKESEDMGGHQKAQKHKSLFSLSLCMSLFYFPFGKQMASGHHHPQRERERKKR